MRAFRNWSIRTKLIVLSLASAAMALAFSAVGVTVNEFRTMISFKSEALQTQARMLAFNCTGALSFDDAFAARQLLASLKAQPAVEFACLYDTEGHVLATYPAGASAVSVPPALDTDDCRVSRTGIIEIFHRVQDRGDNLGGLYLRANTNDLSRQLLAHGKVLAVVLLTGLLLAVAIAARMQRAISGPVLRLGETASRITSEGDYSIRVEEQSQDELGVLCTQFNRMLDRVASSEEALRKAHDELERRVYERTAELHDSQRYLQTILDTLPVGVFLIDGDHERIIEANPVACRMIGAEKDSVVGAMSGRFLGPVPKEQDADSDMGQTVDDTERVLIRTDGVRVPILRTEVPLVAKGRHHRLEAFVDITERKRIESEILRARDAAEAASVAKSQFLANMSHEIRTPLNAIIGFADLLRKNATPESNAESADFLDTIHASARHLLDLINDILDLSKIEADRLEIETVSCSPHLIIQEVLSVLQLRALEGGLSLDYRWQTGVPETISTDPSRLRQLLMNLVGNAIKFTRRGGVEVVASLDQGPPAPRLVIQVIDSGVGIPKEKHEAIFDPFVQADASVTRQFGGTGLGLTISRRIAQALGGEIRVASEPGKGSTFTVWLATGPLDGVPILAAPPPSSMRAATHATQEPLPSLDGLRVLLVEDGTTNRKLVSLVLRRAGATVTMAEDGKLGSDLALSEPFDLILMDMQMPVMDGYEATRLLRQEGLTLPILALTAHAMKGDQDKCNAAGCSGYIAKPIDGDHLVRTIAETIHGSRRPLDDGEVPGLGGLAPPSPSPSTQGADRVPPADAPTASGPPLYSTLDTEDPDFREIVLEFADRLQEKADAMQDAYIRNDYQELACLAHWLKGAGGTAGFPGFTQCGARLEWLAQDRQASEIELALAELKEHAARIAVASPSSTPARG